MKCVDRVLVKDFIEGNPVVTDEEFGYNKNYDFYN